MHVNGNKRGKPGLGIEPGPLPWEASALTATHLSANNICLKRTPVGPRLLSLNRGVRSVQVHFTENKGRKIGLY